MDATAESRRLLAFNLRDAVVERPGDVRAHHLDLVGEDGNGDARFVHTFQMRFEVFARRVEGKADFLGDDPFASRLGGKAVEQYRRHEMVVHVNDQICCCHDCSSTPSLTKLFYKAITYVSQAIPASGALNICEFPPIVT